jgi:hypothetical protein
MTTCQNARISEVWQQVVSVDVSSRMNMKLKIDEAVFVR